MSDWELVEDAPESNNAASSSQSDWELAEPEQEEGLGASAALAIPRIGMDLAKKAYGGVQQIPEYLEKYKTELPGFWQNVFKHPGHFAKQGFAGVNEGINRLAQAPLDIAKYGADRLHLLPQSVPGAIGKITPQDTTEAINQLFGKPEHPGEALLRGVARNADLLVPGNALKNVIPHLTKRGASKTLREAKKLGLERNMGPLTINPELIEDVRQFLPNTHPYRQAIEAAHYGDYSKLFELQSDVGKHSADKAKSFFSSAERAHGREGLSARERLLEAMHQNLQEQGHHDISDMLKQGQEEYRRYKKFVPYRNALIGAGAYAAIPKNALTNLAKKLLLHSSQ